jgi:hypothetical protein
VREKETEDNENYLGCERVITAKKKNIFSLFIKQYKYKNECYDKPSTYSHMQSLFSLM